MNSRLSSPLVVTALLFALWLPAAAGADQGGALRRHPLMIARLVREAARRLVAEPATFLDCGVGPLPGDPSRNLGALRRAFGHARCEVAEVHPFDADAVAGGRLPGLVLVVRDLRLPSMVVDRLELRLTDAVVDLDRLVDRGLLRFVSLGPVTFEASMEARRLASLVPKGWRVGVEEGAVVVEGRERLLWFPTLVRIEGDLEVESGERILFRTRRLNVGNLPFMAFLRGRVTRRLNPLFDLDEYLGEAAVPLALRIEAVRCSDGRVQVTGGGTLSCGPQPSAGSVR